MAGDRFRVAVRRSPPPRLASIHDQPDRQHHAEAGSACQREPITCNDGQRRDQRNRNSDGGDQRVCASSAKDKDDEDDEGQRLSQRDDHVGLAALTNRVCRRQAIFDPLGERFESSSILSLTCCCRSSAFEPGSGTRPTRRSDPCRTRGRGILQRAEFDAGNILHPDNRPAGGIRAHHNVAEHCGVADARLHSPAFESVPSGAGDCPILPAGNLTFCSATPAARRPRLIPRLGRVCRDRARCASSSALTEDLDVADPRNPFQAATTWKIGIVAERDRIDRAVRRHQVHDQHRNSGSAS